MWGNLVRLPAPPPPSLIIILTHDRIKSMRPKTAA